MTDERIKEYLEKGGRLFQVTKMDSYRDGGTKVIETTYGGNKKFFIHMDNNTIHTYYPCIDESLLQDELLKEYIIERINAYVMRFNEQSHRQSRWLLDIILNNQTNMNKEIKPEDIWNKDNKNTEINETDKKLHISDVITRFGLPDETEEKVLRFLHLKGMIKTKTYIFSNFDDVYREMCELREWLGRL